MTEKVFFEVKSNKFWILEQKAEDPNAKKGTKLEVSAWVFQNEKDAIMTLTDMIKKEDVNLEENLDESIEFLSSKYNLQEVQIEKDKYNMKAVSWLKIALVGIADKNK